MKDTKEIAKLIVDTINGTTNDYDAVDEVAKILEEHIKPEPEKLKKTEV